MVGAANGDCSTCWNAPLCTTTKRNTTQRRATLAHTSHAQRARAAGPVPWWEPAVLRATTLRTDAQMAKDAHRARNQWQCARARTCRALLELVRAPWLQHNWCAGCPCAANHSRPVNHRPWALGINTCGLPTPPGIGLPLACVGGISGALPAVRNSPWAYDRVVTPRARPSSTPPGNGCNSELLAGYTNTERTPHGTEMQ